MDAIENMLKVNKADHTRDHHREVVGNIEILARPDPGPDPAIVQGHVAVACLPFGLEWEAIYCELGTVHELP